LERRFYQRPRARQLIAISKRFERDLRECYGWDRPATLVYHGVDGEMFRPAEPGERDAARARFGLTDGDWVWLFVGEAAKGLREAVGQLARFPKARLLVASRSDPGEFRVQARRLGVAERLVFGGFQAQPVAAYHAADVFLYPSPYDPFGLVVGEAMACGLPVVTNPTIGAAEWIESGQTGMLAAIGAGEEWSNCLQRLRDPGFARKMGAAARQSVLRHTWAECAQQTASVYESLLGGQRGAG